MEQRGLGGDTSSASRSEDKILYDLLLCCKWPESVTGVVSAGLLNYYDLVSLGQLGV